MRPRRRGAAHLRQTRQGAKTRRACVFWPEMCCGLKCEPGRKRDTCRERRSGIKRANVDCQGVCGARSDGGDGGNGSGGDCRHGVGPMPFLSPTNWSEPDASRGGVRAPASLLRPFLRVGPPPLVSLVHFGCGAGGMMPPPSLPPSSFRDDGISWHRVRPQQVRRDDRPPVAGQGRRWPVGPVHGGRVGRVPLRGEVHLFRIRDAHDRTPFLCWTCRTYTRCDGGGGRSRRGGRTTTPAMLPPPSRRAIPPPQQQ